jgi:hypothetical protein
VVEPFPLRVAGRFLLQKGNSRDVRDAHQVAGDSVGCVRTYISELARVSNTERCAEMNNEKAAIVASLLNGIWSIDGWSHGVSCENVEALAA